MAAEKTDKEDRFSPENLEIITATRELIDQIIVLAQLIPVDRVVDVVNLSNHVSSFMPFQDPTWYMHNVDNVRDREEIFRIFLEFRRKLETVKIRVLKNAGDR
jgi:hypothetical protein